MSKPGLLLALGLGKKPPKEDVASEETTDEDAGFDSAAKDAFEALKADDSTAFTLALKAAIHECHAETDTESDDSED